jgi:hypothetical protein
MALRLSALRGGRALPPERSSGAHFSVSVGKGEIVPIHNYLSTMPLGHIHIGGIARPFLISALHGSEWSYSRPDRLTPEEGASGIHWI